MNMISGVTPAHRIEPAMLSGQQPGADASLAASFSSSISAYDSLAYGWWHNRNQPRRDAACSIDAPCDTLPAISVIVPLRARRAAGLDAFLHSIRSQPHGPHHVLGIGPAVRRSAIRDVLARHAAEDARVRILHPPSGKLEAILQTALDHCEGDYLLVADGSQTLSPDATFRFAAAIADNPHAALFYCDNDLIDEHGRRYAPQFRTGWDPDAGLARDAAGSLVVVRASILRSALRQRALRNACDIGACIPRLAMRLDPADVVHVPRLLYSAHAERSRIKRPVWAIRAARRYLDWRRLVAARIPKCAGRSTSAPILARGDRLLRDVHPLPANPPSVTVVIPTRDRADLLRDCLEGVLRRTDYPALAVTVVDNGSEQPATLAYLNAVRQEPRVTVLTDDRPFNWGAINNRAVRASTGDVVVLLNDDTQILHRDWLWELVRQAVRPDVGVVGAKLLYPDGTIQHAGVVLGPNGHAMHPFRRVDGRARGYRDALAMVRHASAVTGACMAFRRSVFDAVGGIEEAALAVTWSDVDFCLRARRHGYRVVWTPFARLCHIELATRGADDTPERIARERRERAFMLAKWPEIAFEDRFFNPHLALQEGETRLAVHPRHAED